MKNIILLFLLFNAYFAFAQDTSAVAPKDTLVAIDTTQIFKITTILDTAIVQIDSAAVDSVVNYTAPIKRIDTSLTTSINPKKKKFSIDRVRIMMGFNFSPYTPIAVESDNFQGSYYPVKDSSPVWADRNTKSNLSKTYKTSNIQFFLQANVWKGLFIGMNYQFFSVKNYKKDPNLGNLLSKKSSTFFLVAANFGYVFELLKNKCLQIQPSMRIGGYTADDYYDSGTGKKFYVGLDCKIRYLIKRKAGFSIGVDYDFLRYKKKGYSDIFQRDTYQKTTFSNVSLNVGFVYNITISTHKK